MNIQFCGAAKTVTGSCHLVTVGKIKFLVDCGVFQGSDELEQLNRQPFPFDPREINYVFLTHAHFDHCGRLPLLVKQGFKGKIISTQPTRDLARVVLLDAAKIQEEDYKRWVTRSKDNPQSPNYAGEGYLYSAKEPLYSAEDVLATMELFTINKMSESVTLQEGFEYRMREAGHILGSVVYEFWIKNEEGRERKLVFSGDLGQPGQRIIRDPDMIREADFVIVESTYGDRIHKSKDDTILEFLAILKRAQESNGTVIIPTFAIERAQEIMYELNLFYENNLIKQIPVYLDSPMAVEATEIFKRYPSYFDEDAKRLYEKGDDPFDFNGLRYVSSVSESQRLVSQKNIIIMAGSGMCTGGRVVSHLMNGVSKPNTFIIFVGYQVKGTLGRRLVDGEPTIRIRGKNYEVKAQVTTLGGFSAHADERDLRYWLRGFGHSPRRIFVVHGDEAIIDSFANNVHEELMVDTYVPNMNEKVELD